MFLLLITFDCSTINKCAENSVFLFGTIATDLLSPRIRTFVILPQSTTQGKSPTPEQKRIKEVERFFLSGGGFVAALPDLQGPWGGFEIGLTQKLKPVEPLGPGSANSENCSLLSKARQSRALLWLKFLQFIYQSVGCSGWFFWEDVVWHIQHLETLVLLVENWERMDMDKSHCAWGMNYCITWKNW